jgi:hypothetical protein
MMDSLDSRSSLLSDFELRISDFDSGLISKEVSVSLTEESMRQMQLLFQRRRVFSSLALFIVGMLVFQLPFTIAAQPAYESPPVLSASKILPPELLSGPHHRVEEAVNNNGYFNIYRIDSRFGTFTAVSTAMLRKRIGEINAMVVMEKIQGTTEYLDSIKEGGLDAMQSAMSLVTSPVQTLTGAAKGIGDVFTRVDESLFGGKRSQSEDSRIKDAIGFSATKRQYAYEFDVDVYSDNQKLQDLLNKISWAGYAGSLTWSAMMAAVPGGAGLAMTVVGTNKVLNEVFRNTPPVELRRMNNGKLNAMGVDPQIADAFLNNTIFSPREQTLLVQALSEMDGATDRRALVRLALSAHDPTSAFFRTRQAQMYAGYNKSVTPLVRFTTFDPFAASRTANGTLVFNVPVDYLVWTEAVAEAMDGANQLVNKLPDVRGKQLWLTGTLTSRARMEIENRGWVVRDRTETQLFSAVESYPDYQRPEERLPSGVVSLNFESVALGIGASWGDGVLTFQGKDYPFSVSGLTLVDVGISRFAGAGKVYNLTSPGDLPGTYGAIQSTFAIAGGATDMTMKNQNHVTVVILKNSGKESGTQLSLGPAGMQIQMK